MNLENSLKRYLKKEAKKNNVDFVFNMFRLDGKSEAVLVTFNDFWWIFYNRNKIGVASASFENISKEGLSMVKIPFEDFEEAEEYAKKMLFNLDA